MLYTILEYPHIIVTHATLATDSTSGVAKRESLCKDLNQRNNRA